MRQSKPEYAVVVDFRRRAMEVRLLTEGVRMLGQSRTNIMSHDGTIEHGEWRTNMVIGVDQ